MVWKYERMRKRVCGPFPLACTGGKFANFIPPGGHVANLLLEWEIADIRTPLATLRISGQIV